MHIESKLQKELKEFYNDLNTKKFNKQLTNIKEQVITIKENSDNKHLQKKAQTVIEDIPKLSKEIQPRPTKEIKHKTFLLATTIQKKINEINEIIEVTDKYSTQEIKSLLENLFIESKEKTFIKLNKKELIGILIPEWKKISSDATGWSHKTHTFRIDDHTLKAISFLKHIPEFNNLEKTEKKIITLALFFHDIGKQGSTKELRGILDPEHAHKSALIAKEVMKRLEYNDIIATIVYKLVKHHEFLGAMTFAKRSSNSKIELEKETLQDLKNPKYLDYLHIITLADIYAIKANGKFLLGKVFVAETGKLEQKEKAIQIKYSFIKSRLASATNTAHTEEEKKIFLKTIFKHSYVKGNSKFMFYLVNQWFEVLKVIGISNQSKHILRLLFYYQEYIYKRGFKELIELQEIKPFIITDILKECRHIPKIILTYGFAELITLGKQNGRELKTHTSFITQVLKANENSILSDKDNFQTIIEIFEESLMIRNITPPQRIRIINNTIMRLENEKQLSRHEKKFLIEIIKEEASIVTHTTKLANIKQLQKSNAKRIKINSLQTTLNLDEIHEISKGNLPLCYYNCMLITTFEKCLADKKILSPKQQQLYTQNQSKEYSATLAQLRRQHINKWEKEIHKKENELINENETRSKYFAYEQKWYKFLGAPRPFNAKEDFFSILAHYHHANAIIVELKPDLYKDILWKKMLLGGLMTKEIDLITFNKLTRDLIIKKPIPLSKISRIYIHDEAKEQLKKLLQKYNVNIKISSIQSYKAQYTAQYNEIQQHIK